MKNWPFQDPKNVAVFTNTFIVRDGHAITAVYHDDDDGAWQFHCKHPESNASRNAMIVSLQEIVEIDPTILELYDLPYGWRAVRKSSDASCVREKT